jgi:hypothetical protein
MRVERLAENPIIYPGMPGLEGDRGENINGPSLLRVPEWVEDKLGKYYLYFAHHGGAHIRMAYADTLIGPWMVYEPGVLHMDQGPGRKHIASPDLHVDEERRQLRMYFHQPAPEERAELRQVSFVALSANGIDFEVRPEILGKFYFRVFQYGGWHYALGKYDNVDGVLYRSRDGLAGFEEGPRLLPGVRHTALWVEGDVLHVLYTRVGDAPESILLSTAELSGDWWQWSFSEPALVLAPETEWEGVRLPVESSRSGAVKGPVRQLRDPGIYEEDGERYLLYSVAGEQGIALARLLRG